MAQEKPQNLQDTFLNHVRKSKIPVTVFLVNGVKLQGIITWFDNFCLLLRRMACLNSSISMRFPRSCRVRRSVSLMMKMVALEFS
jgi:RNA chaperone Hfq